MPPKTIEWVGGIDGHVELIDQRLLPLKCERLICRQSQELYEAVRTLAVRGAPAIGVAGAMGLVLAVARHPDRDKAGFFDKLRASGDYLAGCRPTAVNLRWAIDRVLERARQVSDLPVGQIKQELLAEARRIRDEDAAMCRAIGQAGAELIREGSGVLTHCNAGSLATSEYGTALAPLYVAAEQGRKFRVYADETRPLLQGARITAWELSEAGIDVTVLCDSAAAALMAAGKVDLVMTGADRIAANGDTSNKIGTYGVAIAAGAHEVPFYVAAPTSTFDLSLATGADIPIEMRAADEVRLAGGQQTVPDGAAVWNPAFDVTPADRIAGIVTEHGIIRPVNRETVATIFRK